MEEKDISLLRPFDLEAAKRGEPLTSCSSLLNGMPTWTYVAGPDKRDQIVTSSINSGTFASPTNVKCFRMAPLCWVEGKPVYAKDILYRKDTDLKIEVTASHPAKGVVGVSGTEISGKLAHPGRETWAPANVWTWKAPKVKREEWVNIYKDCGDVIFHKTKESADKNTTPARVACVRIEWEEDAK